MDEYFFGAGFNSDRGLLLSGGLGVEPPWSVEVAQEVFEGQTELTYMSVLQGPLDAPLALLTVPCANDKLAGAGVDIFDEQGRPCLSYSFRRPIVTDGVLFVDDGVFRDGQWFLTHIWRRRYTGELNRYGSPEFLETLSRMSSNAGQTAVNIVNRNRKLLGPEYVDPTVDWWDDPDVDVSADGFWEPAPTWGDWDRWFVRDRPGVKLFD